jgi:hypothetical protein
MKKKEKSKYYKKRKWIHYDFCDEMLDLISSSFGKDKELIALSDVLFFIRSKTKWQIEFTESRKDALSFYNIRHSGKEKGKKMVCNCLWLLDRNLLVDQPEKTIVFIYLAIYGKLSWLKRKIYKADKNLDNDYLLL